MAGTMNSGLVGALSLAALALASCGGSADGVAAPPPVAAVPVAAMPSPPAGGGAETASPSVRPPDDGFSAFLSGVRAEALAAGISSATLDSALSDVTHLDRVIELDRRQPEFTLSFDQYLDRIVTPSRVAEGRRRLNENRALLDQIARRHGVPPRFIVAMWGIETNYGRNTGGMSVIAALATLAYDGRRSAYFRRELMQALTIVDQGHITAKAMTGSWAGAMGQCQFMPSTFVRFAVDWDGDGRRDIWSDRGDALASAAHYLSAEGWKKNEGWGRAVRLPANLAPGTTGLDQTRTISEWARLGVRESDGSPLSRHRGPARAAVIEAEPGKGPAFLVYDNFRTIMKWNRSTFFALAAGHLADRIGDR